ncbi:MAG TPA: hypothetical protein PKE65_02535, partial [Rhizobiaceae bacterium]|nr:hypothetical protein [Rhizobiaceae bacterium]
AIIAAAIVSLGALAACGNDKEASDVTAALRSAAGAKLGGGVSASGMPNLTLEMLAQIQSSVTLTLAGGGALPRWIERVGQNAWSMRPPANVERLPLDVTIDAGDGAITRTIIVDVVHGEVHAFPQHDRLSGLAHGQDSIASAPGRSSATEILRTLRG